MAATAAAAFALLVTPGARATNAADWHYAMEMPDSMLQIGSRKLHLPPGHWTLVERGEFTSTAFRSASTTYTVWAVRIENNAFTMGVTLSLPMQRLININRWGPDPCVQRSNLIHQKILSNSAAFPECLSIEGSLSFLQYLRYTNMPVSVWFEGHKFEDTDGLVHILYTKNHNTTFGRVSVFLPTKAFGSDVELVRWAESLPRVLGPFIDNDVDDATLPAPPPVTPAEAP